MAIVVIDPGHGGSSSVGGSSPNNATGPGGTKEKSLTLIIGERAHAALVAAGHTARLTRTTDVNLGLPARAHIARGMNADAFVSIHLNASNEHNAQGTETWNHTNHSAASRRLAERVQARVRAATGLNDRGVKQKGLGVLSPGSHAARTACCLVEVSFLDRADEENRLRQPNHQEVVGRAIAHGIEDFLAGAMPSFSISAEVLAASDVESGGDCDVVTDESRAAPRPRRKKPTRKAAPRRKKATAKAKRKGAKKVGGAKRAAARKQAKKRTGPKRSKTATTRKTSRKRSTAKRRSR
jgi:N-acetylmuramoyl-L-alanine amidase